MSGSCCGQCPSAWPSWGTLPSRGEPATRSGDNECLMDGERHCQKLFFSPERIVMVLLSPSWIT